MAKPTALVAYGFAGGLVLGISKHVRVLAALEDGYGVKTLRHNFPRLEIRSPARAWGQVEDFRGVDWVVGNPPCAAWSVAGYTKTRGKDKWRTDPRVECTTRLFGLLRTLRPKVWTWESVTQAYTKGIEFVRALEADAIAEGYSVTYVLHNAKWLGLPQVRRRFFMICHRIDLPLPALNWAPPPTTLEVLQDVPEELRHPEKITSAWSISTFTPRVLRKVPPGTRLATWWNQQHPEEEREYREDGACIGRPSYGHYRLHPTEPSGAVVGYGLVHPVEHRFITTKEYQALSGFPMNYEFLPGSASARASEIARGLCPPVASWLARMVASAIESDRHSPVLVREADFREPPQPTWTDRPMIRFLDPGRPLPVGEGEVAPATRMATPREKAPRRPPSGPPRASLKAPPPAPASRAGERSGEYIRRLLRLERYTTAEIVETVHRNYAESKATAADVAWHRGEMKQQGAPVRVVRQLKDGTRTYAS